MLYSRILVLFLGYRGLLPFSPCDVMVCSAAVARIKLCQLRYPSKPVARFLSLLTYAEHLDLLVVKCVTISIAGIRWHSVVDRKCLSAEQRRWTEASAASHSSAVFYRRLISESGSRQ